ncbi:MAG: YbbR-like domain-containing protein, partial [Anaerovoracaceae bacterium]
MLSNKKANFIIALVFAIILWMYVVGKMDPSVTKSYRDIHVSYQNQQTLIDRGLALADGSVSDVDITVSGKRSHMAKFSRSKITATVDLSELNEGKSEVDIKIRVPKGYEVTGQSDTKSKVVVEKRVTVVKNVKVNYTGISSDTEEPATIRLYPETVKVSGAKSLVKKVTNAQADVPRSGVESDLTSSNSDLKVVDKHGKKVKGVVLSQTTAAVSSRMFPLKKVRLNVSVKDDSDDGKVRVTDVPGVVYIKGPESKLKDIESIVAKRVDVTNITEDTDVKIEPVLPDGVSLSDRYDGSIEMSVDVSKKKSSGSSNKNKLITSRTISFTSSDVEFTHTGSKKINAGDTDLQVQITGTSSQLSKIKSSDIVLTADCSKVR